MAKIIDEHPQLSQLSEPVPELLTIMELTNCLIEPVLDVFPSKLAHDPIFASTHVQLEAVKFTEKLVVLFGPVGSDSLFLLTLLRRKQCMNKELALCKLSLSPIITRNTLIIDNSVLNCLYYYI
jgi:hypothetical protein